MSVFYNTTFICDSCGEEYLVTSEFLLLPPHWIIFQPLITDKYGLINNKEEESSLLHFCSTQCVAEYVFSQQFSERVLLVDDDEDEEDGEKEENNDKDDENPGEIR